MLAALLGRGSASTGSRSGSAIDAVFAPLAGPLVLLLWMYVSAFAVLQGAELNAEIEKMGPTVRIDDRAEQG